MIFAASVITILSLTSSTSPGVAALSLSTPSLLQRHHSLSFPSQCRTTTALHLTDPTEDTPISESDSELDALISKREAMKKQSIANIKPNDNKPSLKEMEKMSEADLFKMFQEQQGTSMDDVMKWTTAGDLPQLKTSRPGAEEENMPDFMKESKKKETADPTAFIDYEFSFQGENELRIPNRIGFSTCDWGDKKKGFVVGKLKKKDRKAGKYNKSDLKKVYTALTQKGVNFIETSESYSIAEGLLNKFMEEVDAPPDYEPIITTTFSNPWKMALRNKSLPRRGAKAIVDAAEASAKRLGIDSLDVYQVQNPGLYIGGTKAIANGLLDTIGDDHTRYIGCVNWSVPKLQKLQYYLDEIDGAEFIATNQFEFSITNRKNLKMIEACKKMGITPICTNVLDGGLASGMYTSLNPTGDKAPEKEGDMGPFKVKKLEALDMLFKAMEKMAADVSKRVAERLKKFGKDGPKVSTDITTTQLAINYVKAKGAVPLVSVTDMKDANMLLGTLGWDLTPEEVEKLDKICAQCGI